MQSTENLQLRNSEITKAKKMQHLLDDKNFQELFLDDFVTGGILQQVLHNRIDNSLTQDELNARKIFHKYVFDIISNGEKLEHH